VHLGSHVRYLHKLVTLSEYWKVEMLTKLKEAINVCAFRQSYTVLAHACYFVRILESRDAHKAKGGHQCVHLGSHVRYLHTLVILSCGLSATLARFLFCNSILQPLLQFLAIIVD